MSQLACISPHIVTSFYWFGQNKMKEEGQKRKHMKQDKEKGGRLNSSFNFCPAEHFIDDITPLGQVQWFS